MVQIVNFVLCIFYHNFKVFYIISFIILFLYSFVLCIMLRKSFPILLYWSVGYKGAGDSINYILHFFTCYRCLILLRLLSFIYSLQSPFPIPPHTTKHNANYNITRLILTTDLEIDMNSSISQMRKMWQKETQKLAEGPRHTASEQKRQNSILSGLSAKTEALTTAYTASLSVLKFKFTQIAGVQKVVPPIPFLQNAQYTAAHTFTKLICSTEINHLPSYKPNLAGRPCFP